MTAGDIQAWFLLLSNSFGFDLLRNLMITEMQMMLFMS